jgi:hypothetical protein
MIAISPAKIGTSKLVPPATVRFTVLTSRKPFEQLPVIPVVGSLEQYKKPALFGDAAKEISGTSRIDPPMAEIPGTPACHGGLAVRTLIPPPVELSTPGLPPLGPKSSFQTCSGM